MNDFVFITPEELKLKRPDYDVPLEELRKIANRKAHKCQQPFCDLDEWKFAGTGFCFTHTTGELHANQDYELIPSKNRKGN